MKRILLILISTHCLSACDVLMDQALDCINNDKPKFNRSTLPTAVLNQEYDTQINASIRNNAFDNSYQYSFNLTGDLPSGLSYYSRWDSSELRIWGTPTEYGHFHFTLSVTASDKYSYHDDSDNYYDDGDSLCNNRHSQSYTLSVNTE